jgi:Ran GTPase-activating protein (RanGAP) involved in mRNA processing and transport
LQDYDAVQFLVHLDLSSNDIGGVGAAALVQNCGNLTNLDLSCTDVSSSGLCSVASHLCANSAKIKLRSLNLSRNQFGDKAIDQLCTAISSNTQLQSIDLSGCGLGNASARRLLNLVHGIKHAQAASRRRHLLQVPAPCSRWLEHPKLGVVPSAQLTHLSGQECVQEVTFTHNSRMDSTIASNIKEALLS